MNRFLKQIINAWNKDDYGCVFKLLEEADSKVPHPALYVIKGMSIKMSDHDYGFRNKDAEDAFKKAIKIDEDYIDAYIELGWHYFNTKDDVNRAMPVFQDAFELCIKQFTEIMDGMLRCLGEAKSKKAAEKFLDSIPEKLIKHKRIQKTLKELEIDYPPKKKKK